VDKVNSIFTVITVSLKNKITIYWFWSSNWASKFTVFLL